MMRIHRIQTGTVRVRTRQAEAVRGGPARRADLLLDRTWTAPLPIAAWAVEHPDGVVLVDTGETSRVMRPGYFPRWHPYFRFGVRFDVRPEDEVAPQLRAVGIEPADVRTVVLTHLHTDHAGGLGAFERARILVGPGELQAASGVMGRINGYLRNRWPAWFAPEEVRFGGGAYGPFDRHCALTGDGAVVVVPTPGHTPGHVSVVVEDRVFLAGDASYTEDAMLRRAVDGVSPDERAARATLDRIAAFVQETGATYLPTHDPEAAARLAQPTSARTRSTKRSQ